MSDHHFPPMAHRLPELRIMLATLYYSYLFKQNDDARYQPVH